MREILFRGKREDNGEWVFGYPIYHFADCTAKRKGKCVCNHNGELIGFIAWKDQEHEYGNVQVDPSTVGQHTGLADKNGRKIFEGDIIEFVDIFNETVRGVVYWCNGAFCADCTTPDGNESFHGIGYLPVECAHIIGNINDNPELLKGGNENG